MIFEPKIFYKTYLNDFHKFKSILYNKILEDLPKYEIEMFGQELEKEHRDAFRRTIKSDLRQTYYHSIESFFELFFALLSNNKPNFDDQNILFTLTNSNWKTNYDKITKIASDEISLDFLDEEVIFNGHTTTVGHYLFYFGLFDKTKLPANFFEKANQSIEAIKYGIKIIAKDFVDREEYNSYKHGLRIIPATSELMLADAQTMEIKIRWNLEDSMSFYSKTKDPNELKIKTKLFDTNRDYAMTYFCSNLISNLVFTRQVSMYKEQKIKEKKQMAVAFFGKKEIEDCNKMNVEIQDLVYSIKRVTTENKGSS
jgi:hypothetical protein